MAQNVQNDQYYQNQQQQNNHNHDDDDDDRMSDTSDIDPDSAVLAPVQEKIANQLLRHIEQLSLELHEATNEAKMMRQKREECGVELDNVQQHLAKLQEGRERGHDNLVA